MKTKPFTPLTYQETLELIERLCQDEDDEFQMEIYELVHSVNTANSCYASHQDWRKKAVKLKRRVDKLNL